MSTEKTVAVVGATGAVGQTMLSILEQRNFPVGKLIPFASERSAGKQISFKGKQVTIEPIKDGCFKGVDVALFSAGGSISEAIVPKAVEDGAIVVDNTSAFRYVPEIPLVVPEVNRHDIAKHKGIIANPNCSTIQLLVALKPLHDAFKVKRFICSTYQATSGAGATARQEMFDNTKAILDGEKFENKKFVHPIAFNALPHIDKFLEKGYTKEEMKMVWETHKIMGDDTIGVTSTCVRIPVASAHSESVYVELGREVTPDEAREAWNKAPGVIVVDNPAENLYPMPVNVEGTDDVQVGRIREDLAVKGAINFWCVGDNLRKGAALNAVQIAECLVEDGII